MMRGQSSKEELIMKVIFTNLVNPYSQTGISNMKPSGFIFTEADRRTLKVVSAMGCAGMGSGNGTIEDAVTFIVGVIKENSEDKDRLLLELEIAMDYFKSSKEISTLFEKILEGIVPKEADLD